MHFDDRIATVLRQRGGSAAVARIQFRQLIDLLGALGSDVSTPAVDAAMDRLGELGGSIPAEDRAAILREHGLRLRNPRLVAVLANGEPKVVQAVIGQAQLSKDQWLDLAPALPASARAAIGDRRDLPPALVVRLQQLGIARRALPASAEAGEQAAPLPKPRPITEPAAEDRDAQAEGGIAAIVRRIEEYTRARRTLDAESLTTIAPRLPLGEERLPDEIPAPLAALDFLSDGEGRIIWAEAPVLPMVYGLRLTAADRATAVQASADLRLRMQRRLPIEGALISIDGAPAIAGDWRINAAACFDPIGGRFTGYRGRLRRPSARTITAPPPSAAASQGDQIRQLLHELRTPINAIQGFGEIIQQQLFGPTPHEYRALAAGIVGDAARILAGFEELERLAKLDTGAQTIEPGSCDVRGIAAAITDQLNAHMRARDSRFEWQHSPPTAPVAMASEEAERMVWRLFAALANQAAPGEVLRLKARMRGDMVRFKLELPQALARLDDRELFQATASANPQVISASMFGTGFALRLAATEANAAGGSLERHKDWLVLSLPGLTGDAAESSPDTQSNSAG